MHTPYYDSFQNHPIYTTCQHKCIPNRHRSLYAIKIIQPYPRTNPSMLHIEVWSCFYLDVQHFDQCIEQMWWSFSNNWNSWRFRHTSTMQKYIGHREHHILLNALVDVNDKFNTIIKTRTQLACTNDEQMKYYYLLDCHWILVRALTIFPL